MIYQTHLRFLKSVPNKQTSQSLTSVLTDQRTGLDLHFFCSTLYTRVWEPPRMNTHTLGRWTDVFDCDTHGHLPLGFILTHILPVWTRSLCAYTHTHTHLQSCKCDKVKWPTSHTEILPDFINIIIKHGFDHQEKEQALCSQTKVGMFWADLGLGLVRGMNDVSHSEVSRNVLQHQVSQVLVITGKLKRLKKCLSHRHQHETKECTTRFTMSCVFPVHLEDNKTEKENISFHSSVNVYIVKK